MVAKTDQKARLFDLWGSIVELVRGGKRDPEEVAGVLQAIKDGKKLQFGGEAAEAFSGGCDQLVLWRTFLREMLGIELHTSTLSVPASQAGFNWLIVVPNGMTSDKIIVKMRKHMKVWVWDEKELKKVTSVREPDKAYAIWVRDRVEADEELRNKSADNLKSEGVNCITLPERLMLEFFYWWRTKEHLDVNNWTHCAGSRDSDGYVPYVSWDASGGGVCVHWSYGDYRNSDLRGRVAVS